MQSLIYTKRKKSRQPSCIKNNHQPEQDREAEQTSIYPEYRQDDNNNSNHNKASSTTPTQPDHLRYPAAIIQQCRTGYTRYINVGQFGQQYEKYQQQLQQTVDGLNHSDTISSDISVDDLLVPTPYQRIQLGIDSEIAAIGAWLNEGVRDESSALKEMVKQSLIEAKEKRRLRYQSKREAEREHYTKKGKKETKEDKEDHKQEEKEALQEYKEEKENDTNNVSAPSSSSAGPAMSRLPRGVRKASLSTSLSCVTTATRPSHLSAAVVLPEKFGEQVIPYQQLIQPMKEAIAATPCLTPTTTQLDQPGTDAKNGAQYQEMSKLPESLFASIIDPNTLTTEAFTQNYQQKMTEKRKSLHEDSGQSPTGSASSSSVDKDSELLPLTTPLLRISVYSSHRLQSEFVVHAQQTLADFTESIECTHKQPRDSVHKESEVVFIEQTLYHDQSSLGDDARICVRMHNWLKEDERFSAAALSPYSYGDLTTTRFDSLTIRIGSHYLFHHGVDCLHTFIITDLRIIHPLYDLRQASAYPLLVCRSALRRHDCSICHICTAVYVVSNDLLLHTNPSFLCASCYQLLHYDKEGKLMYGGFQVYPLQSE